MNKNMKKTYMMPNIKVVEAEIENLLGASDPQTSIDPDATPIEAASIDSRRGVSIWDDFEE